jgi:mercuric ion transport protein
VVEKQPGRLSMTVTSVGGLVTAFLASICCIGPLAFAALGVSVGATGLLAGTAGALKALLPYRPLFIGLTVLLLGFGFSLVYRKPRVREVSCLTCAPGTGARLNRLMLWIMAGFAVALIFAPYWLEFAPGS